MHHTHTSRPPPHTRHNAHQATAPSPQMHPPPLSHPSQPQVGTNVGPPHIGPPPPPPAAIQQQQQHHHHVTSIAPPNLHGAPPPLPPQKITQPYIPPHQRDTSNRLNHHVQQRINSQIHQTQSKNRLHGNNLVSGGSLSATVPVSSNVPQQQQQLPSTILQQQKHSNLQQKTTILTKSTMLQQQSSHSQTQNTHHHHQHHQHHHHQQLQQQQLSKHPPSSFQSNSSLPSPLPQRQHHPLPNISSSSSHQQTTLQQQNFQTLQQPKAILTPKSNVHQQQQKSSTLQGVNSQKQNPITILQKNPAQNVHQQQQQPQKQLNHIQKNTQSSLSTSSSSASQQFQVQHKIQSKSQSVHQNVTNDNKRSGGDNTDSSSGDTNNNVTLITSNVPQQIQHHQQKQPNVQSNQIITSSQSQNSQTTTTNKQNLNTENKIDCVLLESNSTITSSQQQQQLQQQQDKANHQNDDLICVNNKYQNMSMNETLANTKEKTPMCLVNELARFNKIQHQYRLTGEQGPAHSKRFTVTLKLGEEEYTAEGPSIKKAQHSAAAEAVCETKYTHPPVKSSRLKNGRNANGGAENITPTVELNALAMKLGKPTVYVFDPPLPQPSQHTEGGISTSVSGQPGSGPHSLPPPPLPSSSSSLSSPHHHNPSSYHQHHNGDGSSGPITTIGVNSQGTTLQVTGGTQINGPTTKPTIQHPQQQNHFSMHISNHTYYQESHHYQPCTRQNSMNIYQPPAARFSGGGGFQSRKTYSTRGNGFYKYNPHSRMTYNGISSVISKEMCKITLMVGKQKFIGIGETPQAARHDAAARALEVLKPLVIPTDESNEINSSNNNIDDPNADLKSPISLVHETALKRNLQVIFEVKLEKGPPHMKTFVTLCKVGNVVTEGEGNGKKISKKRAAEKMLEELKKLPPLSPFKNQTKNHINVTRVKNLKRKPQLINKKKIKNIIKNNSESAANHDEINPISKLIQIQQALKEREPIYTLIEEKGAPRRREFVIEVSAGGHVARGTGPNKKMAKKLAAKNLLILMGYDNNKENNSKVANGIETINKNLNEAGVVGKIETTTTATGTPTRTVLKTTNQGGSAGRQIVPGLLLMQQQPSTKNTEIDSTLNHKLVASTNINISTKINGDRSSDLSAASSSLAVAAAAVSHSGTTSDNNSSINTSTISDNMTKNSSSSSSLSGVSNNNNNNSNNSVNCDGVRPKDQLLYLADLLGFQVGFSNYPKGNHREYLTIVTLSTDPPQICHGAGNDADASQDEAAMTALQMLSNLGLDNVKPKRVNHIEMEEKKSIVSGVSKD